MRLALVEVNGVLGLNGEIDLTKNPTLFYGKNLAGKTNIINLIRYCLVLGKASKKYSEEKRLDKNEILAEGTKIGTCTFYFAHASKLYKLDYLFKRTSRSVSQKITFSGTAKKPQVGEDTAAALKAADWTRMADGAKELKDKFKELQIYSDVIDLLISPSNVRNFTDAINSELVTVPEIIAKQVSQIHNGAEKLLGNMEKLNGILVQEKETYSNKLLSLAEDYQKAASEDANMVSEMFVVGKASNTLQTKLESVDKQLTALPSRETQLELFKQRWSSEFLNKFRRITKAKEILGEEATVIELKEKAAILKSALESLRTWSITFKTLPSRDNIQSLAEFTLPKLDEKVLECLVNPERTSEVFDLLHQAKLELKVAAVIAKRYKVTLALSEIRSLASSYKKLAKAIKSPAAMPKGDNAIITYSSDEGESTIFLPVDSLIRSPNYLRGIKPTPAVYRTKTQDKSALRKVTGTIQSTIKGLETCRDRLNSASDKLETARRLTPLMGGELTNLENQSKEAESIVNDRLTDWQTSMRGLGETFGFAPQKFDLENIEGINGFIAWFGRRINEVASKFAQEFTNAAKTAGISFANFKMDNLEGLERLIDSQSQEILEQKKKLQKTKDWLGLHLNELKAIEDYLLSIATIEKATIVLDVVMTNIKDYTNLDTMSEQISQAIEENVKACQEMILPEETVRFHHCGKGTFMIETSTGQSLTHPAGSHKAVISLGIMLTLAKLFDLPVILDEATDRFDYLTLRNAFRYVDALSKDEPSPQVCFVSYRTLNIERDQEMLDLVRGWNLYSVEKQGSSKAVGRISDISAIPTIS